ncbi:MAG: tetratricopeptide repeat protein, partial [Chloroflexi bacterium]|nr:tetratricopeptide repeat protein [Chloroflexota bacterium]
CGADLSLLADLDAVADAWFNEALKALAAGAPARALEWLAASCAARPTDAAVLRALARVWAQLGHPGAARDALDRAAEIEPDDPDLEGLRQALRDAEQEPRR